MSRAGAILVTGFEPFGGEPVNASWEAARALDGARIGACAVVARRLAVVYGESAAALAAALDEIAPAAVLLSGQAASRGAVCVERFARNRDAARAPDNRGERRRAPIEPGAPMLIETTAPVARIAQAMRAAGLPARVSLSAGAYVCNHVYFSALRLAARRRPEPPVLFVHLPATPAQGGAGPGVATMASEDASRALRLAAQALVEEA